MSLGAYLRWRVAAARYGRRPWELGPDERTAAEAQAAREERVIARAVAAPESGAVEADREVVAAALAAMAAGYADRPAFLADLARGGLSEETLAWAIGEELRAGVVLDRIGAAAVVDASAVRAWYERNRGRLVTPERRVASHILMTCDAGDGADHRAVRERVEGVAEALAAGSGFEALALRHSECPTALEGGRLGEVRRGQLYPELEALLFALEPGGFGIAASPLGWHLLRCDAVIPAQPLDFETAAPSIRKRLESTARERRQKAWLAAATEAPGAREG